MRLAMCVILMLGCASRTPSTQGTATQASTRSAESESVGVFAGVVNLDGTPRSRDDLMGHPTVVWFFPFAGTPG
ncbi:MAG: hypothetical protein AB8H79_21090 [Myxococcota bacterium]